MLRTLNLACVTKSVHRKSIPKYDALFLALHALCILIAAFSRARSSTSSSMITLRLCRSRERRAVVEVGLIEAFRGSAVGSTTSRSVGSLSMKVCVDLKALKSCTSTYTHSSVVRSVLSEPWSLESFINAGVALAPSIRDPAHDVMAITHTTTVGLEACVVVIDVQSRPGDQHVMISVH